MKILLEHTENRNHPTGIAVHQKNLYKILSQDFDTSILYDDFNIKKLGNQNIKKFIIFTFIKIFLASIFKISILFFFNSNKIEFPKYQEYLVSLKKKNFLNIYGFTILKDIFSFLTIPIKIYLHKNQFDIVHCPFLNTYVFINTHKISTIHDTIPFDHPDFVRSNLSILKKKYQDSISSSDLIYTVSETSKKNIIKHFNVPPHKIFVTYQSFIPPKYILDISKLLKKYDLEKNKYFIYYGAIEPKKNIINLVKAYLHSKSSCKLLIIKSKGWSNKEILTLLDSESRNNNIVVLDHIKEEILFSLVKNSKALLFPSYAEGFGLPVLESMHYLVPCIISNIEVFREIYDDAAIYVNPHSIKSISNGIKSLEYSNIIDHLKLKMKKINNKFSIENYASNIKEGYNLLK